MKKFFAAALVFLVVFRAAAQVSLELALNQDEFLPNETIPLAVKVTNVSGQQLHLGADPSWLTFGVETTDGTPVPKNGEVPVVDPFDLESSQMGTKHVDLEPYFQLTRPDRYKVIATMRVKEWGLTVKSDPVFFDIIGGVDLWSQNFGVAVTNDAPPESRQYALIKANYLQKQLRLYLQVSSNDRGCILKLQPLGTLLSFSQPEEEIGRYSKLHVLWQTGAQTFSYVIVSPDGDVLSRDLYDDFNSRPRLIINEEGDIIVHGGVRRPKPGEIPLVQPPAPAPGTSAPPATP